SLGASVPADHLTDCAAAGPVCATTRPAAAVMDSVVSTSRRVQSVGIVEPSRWARSGQPVWPKRAQDSKVPTQEPRAGYRVTLSLRAVRRRRREPAGCDATPAPPSVLVAKLPPRIRSALAGATNKRLSLPQP